MWKSDRHISPETLENPSKKSVPWSSCRGAMVSTVSLEHWISGSIPGLAQWVKEPVLLQLWLSLWLWLGTDPRSGNSICCRWPKKKKKKKKTLSPDFVELGQDLHFWLGLCPNVKNSADSTPPLPHVQKYMLYPIFRGFSAGAWDTKLYSSWILYYNL